MDLFKLFVSNFDLDITNLENYMQWLNSQDIYQFLNAYQDYCNLSSFDYSIAPLQQQEALDLSIKKTETRSDESHVKIWKSSQRGSIKQEKEQRKDNSNVISCAMCACPFMTMNQLNRHFADQHKEFIVKYSYNLQHSRSKLTFQAHLASLRCLNQTKTDDKLQCPSCNYRAKWPTELEKHVMVHSFGRPFSCYICSKSYKWIWDLGRHFHKNHSQFDNPYRKTSKSKTKSE